MVASDAIERLRKLPCGKRLMEAAEGLDGVHLVGGAVRDLLLDRAPRELDVVSEGDLAPILRRLGGTTLEHDRFGTVVVEADGCRYDLVRARTESYAGPGALPDVLPGTLADDLRRRDLTINAIAVALPAGTVTALPGALEDLEEGWLRVLHDDSFSDDPTRLWRLARYAARLGFAIDPHTYALARAADPTTVSGVRMGNELRLALREPDPLAVVEVARTLNDDLLPSRFITRPGGVGEALGLLAGEGRVDLVILARCVLDMGATEVLAWLDAMGFTAAERDVVAAGSRPSTWRPLQVARTASEIARAARGAPVEVVALAGGPNARRWLQELRHVRLEITGSDLLAAGIPEGPEIGRRLQAALDRKLDGELAPGRDAELAAALAA